MVSNRPRVLKVPYIDTHLYIFLCTSQLMNCYEYNAFSAKHICEDRFARLFRKLVCEELVSCFRIGITLLCNLSENCTDLRIT